jgi:dTDP-4-amino-4,6-dideoxygalactose transaminase
MTVQPVISCSLSPDTEPDDIRTAIRILLQPWKWRYGKNLRKVSDWFKTYIPGSEVFTFNSGRTALFAILKAFSIGPDDEVLLQAFTCVAVPNSIIWVGAKPIYIDIDESLNIDPTDIERKITVHTKAIIVQHTFGIPAQMDAIIRIARKHHLILIEDCAHGIGAMYKGQMVGTFGDAAFFSFGRDKAVSSVWGGAAVVHSKFKNPASPAGRQISKLKALHENLSVPGYFWIFQQLLHPITLFLIIRLYNVGIGKCILIALQHLRLLSIPVYPEEKYGGRPKHILARYPNALAYLLVNQLAKINRFTRSRTSIAHYYRRILAGRKDIVHIPEVVGSSYLRYPILVKDKEFTYSKARRSGVLLGRWYQHVIDPKEVRYTAIGYTEGSCPNAQKKAAQILNLPTLIKISDARRVFSSLV